MACELADGENGDDGKEVRSEQTWEEQTQEEEDGKADECIAQSSPYQPSRHILAPSWAVLQLPGRHFPTFTLIPTLGLVPSSHRPFSTHLFYPHPLLFGTISGVFQGLTRMFTNPQVTVILLLSPQSPVLGRLSQLWLFLSVFLREQELFSLISGYILGTFVNGY